MLFSKSSICTLTSILLLHFSVSFGGDDLTARAKRNYASLVEPTHDAVVYYALEESDLPQSEIGQIIDRALVSYTDCFFDTLTQLTDPEAKELVAVFASAEDPEEILRQYESVLESGSGAFKSALEDRSKFCIYKMMQENGLSLE